MSGRHRGQCREPGSLTGSQREMITGWTAVLGLAAQERATIIRGVTGSGTSVDDLSESQAGDLLETFYMLSRS